MPGPVSAPRIGKYAGPMPKLPGRKPPKLRKVPMPARRMPTKLAFTPGLINR